MTPPEAAALLGIACGFDNRQPSEEAAIAWAAALGDVSFADARAAVVDHYSREATWLMPASIRRSVRRIRDRRLEVAGELTPPRDLDPDDVGAYQRWLRGARRAAADGHVEPAQPGLVSAPARMRALVAAAAPKAEVE